MDDDSALVRARRRQLKQLQRGLEHNLQLARLAAAIARDHDDTSPTYTLRTTQNGYQLYVHCVDGRLLRYFAKKPENFQRVVNESGGRDDMLDEWINGPLE